MIFSISQYKSKSGFLQNVVLAFAKRKQLGLAKVGWQDLVEPPFTPRWMAFAIRACEVGFK